MTMLTIYFITLFIAPQLWIEPFVGIPVDYFVYPLWMAVVVAQGRFSALFRFQHVDWFFLAMLAWIFLTTIVNPGNAKTIGILVDYTKWFILYRLIVVSVPTMLQVRKAMWLLLIFTVVLVIEGIQHKLSVDGLGWAGQSLGWVDPSVTAAGGTGRTRWINIFDGPGVFCVVYTIGLPIVLMLLGPPFGGGMRLLAYAMLGPLLLAIYYTGSRGGFLATLAIIALYLLLRLRVSLTKIGIVSAVVGVAFMLAPSHLTSVRDENKSAQYRVEMWAEGVEMVTYNPLFGIGKGNYAIYTSKLIAHNSAIEIMGETGAPGLFLWISLLYLSFKGLFRYRTGEHSETDKAYATSLALIVVGYLASSMFVTLEYETLYMLLGLCVAVSHNLNEPVKYTARDFRITAIATVAWIVLVKAVAMMYF